MNNIRKYYIQYACLNNSNVIVEFVWKRYIVKISISRENTEFSMIPHIILYNERWIKCAKNELQSIFIAMLLYRMKGHQFIRQVPRQKAVMSSVFLKMEANFLKEKQCTRVAWAIMRRTIKAYCGILDLKEQNKSTVRTSLFFCISLLLRPRKHGGAHKLGSAERAMLSLALEEGVFSNCCYCAVSIATRKAR